MARPSRHYDGLDYLVDRFIGDDPKKRGIYEQALLDTEIARQIYDLRMAAGLTQSALAARVGTSTSVICRLEDSDYKGHSMSLLRRIASALSCNVEVRFVPAKRRHGANAKAKKRRIA